jgi:putative membrane protein
MKENPYERFQSNELILRDELAIDRTILANERTLMSYLRGAVALVIAGVTFLHFFDAGTLHYIGLVCVPLGLATGILGFTRYRKMNRRIRATRQSLEQGNKK